MAKKQTTPPSPETLERVISAIRGTSEPVTAAQIAKLLVGPDKLSEARLAPILVDFVSQARLHPFPARTAKGKPRYWDRDAREFSRTLIVSALDKKDLSRVDLRKAARQLTDDAFQQAFQSLLDTHGVYEHPPLPKKKTCLFGRHPPSPEPYLRDLGQQLTRTIEQLKQANVPQETLRSALVELVEATGVPFGRATSPPTSVSPDGVPAGTAPSGGVVDLIGLMRSIEPGADNGALVASRELRRAARLPKADFDRAVLELGRLGRLMLHRHDFVGGLTPEERDELVTDGAGAYYVGMAIRRNPAG